MTRARGFTLIEILIALGLASVVSAGILMLARSQLMAQEVNDQLLRAQANARAGIDFLETVMRRACGGSSQGGIGVNVGSVQTQTSCVRVIDGGTTGSDVLEVIYPTSSPTVVTALATAPGSPSATVADLTGFAVDDFVLVSADTGIGANLFKIASITPGTAPGGTLGFYPFGGAMLTPQNTTLGSGSFLFKAASIGVSVQTTGVYQNMLVLDSDGIAGATPAEPLIDGVEDFQVAVGNDLDGNGVIVENPLSPGTDEWVGNVAGELPLAIPSLTPWNVAGSLPQYRTIRATLLVRTINTYPGFVAPLGRLEDRDTYPSVALAPPRYRPERITVAPRSWNLQ